MEDNTSDGFSDNDETDFTFTDAIRPPPFPLNVESTWFLATIWVLLGATNAYVQLGLDSILGLRSILLKTIATVIVAGLTMVFYDGYLTKVNEERRWINHRVELILASLVARHWGIALNEDATLEDQKEALMQGGTLQVPRTVFAATSELATGAVDCALVLTYQVSVWQLLSAAIWMSRLFLGLPNILVNAAVIAGLLLCGRWLSDTNVGRFLRLWDVCDKVKSLVARCLESPLALLDSYWSPGAIKQPALVALCAILTAASWALPTDVIMPFTGQDVDILARHVDTLKSFIYGRWSYLFSPKFDGSWLSVGHFGAQAGLQLSLAAVCFLFTLIYHCQSQEKISRARSQWERGEVDMRYVDEDDRVTAAQWRATALHIISFTAYQVAGMMVSALELEPLLQSTALAPKLRDVLSLREDRPEAAYRLGIRVIALFVTGLSICAIHWVLRRIVWLLIRLLTWTAAFGDAVAWCTTFTRPSLARVKSHVMDTVGLDFKLKDKTLLAQGLMNCLFDTRAPLVIIPPNYSIHAFDPEAWALED
ncbi:hypothetical protein PG999_005775 [Apiospora kogelbergensis]|uniref:Uncharacterized protein n=1 Tax=Apiospora kogelbergensis TaxID=1337665 RepID=A0AAW0QSH8_9PEZI